MNASGRVVNYLQTIQSLPASGPERLAFFQNYFEDKERVLAFDAYDEFAQAPYEDVIALKDKMKREQLINWIKDPETATNRRRLYFTMLGVCGLQSDIELLEEYIKSGDRKKQAGLDALVACYLKLKGEDGLPLIVDSFLKKEVEYVDTLSAVSALRFHGTEVDFIERKSIVKAVRTLLDRPKIADMVIPDLARWEDWTVMERLVQMFKDADQDTSWLRVPIASYLRACPLPEAKAHIEELKKIDPDSIKRADFFLDFDDKSDDDSDDEDSSDDKSKSKDNADDDLQKNDEAKASDSSKEPVESGSGGTQTLASTAITDFDSDTANTANVSETYVAQRITIPDTPANTATTASVSKTVESAGDLEKRSVALKAPQLTKAVAVASIVPVPLWQIVLIPFACSILIFVLLWSVISGWFDRLIY
jgi:hypothetical protein